MMDMQTTKITLPPSCHLPVSINILEESFGNSEIIDTN